MPDPSLYDMFTMVNESIKKLSKPVAKKPGDVSIGPSIFQNSTAASNDLATINQGNYNPFTDPNFANRDAAWRDKYLKGLDEAANLDVALIGEGGALGYGKFANLFSDEDYRKALLGNPGLYGEHTLEYGKNVFTDSGGTFDSSNVWITMPDGEKVEVMHGGKITEAGKGIYGGGIDWMGGLDPNNKLQKQLNSLMSKIRNDDGSNKRELEKQVENIKGKIEVLNKKRNDFLKTLNTRFLVDKKTNKLIDASKLKNVAYTDVVKNAGGIKGMYDKVLKSGDAGLIKQFSEAIQSSEGLKGLLGENVEAALSREQEEFAAIKNRARSDNTSEMSTIINRNRGQKNVDDDLLSFLMMGNN